MPELIAWSCHHSNCPLLAVEQLCDQSAMKQSAGGRNNVTKVDHSFSQKTRPKTHLFRKSFPDLVRWLVV